MDIQQRFMWGQPPKPALSEVEGAVQRAKLAQRESPTKRVPHFSRAFCARSGEVACASRNLTNTIKWTIVFIGLITLTACSPRDYLTRRLATDLIATSETFNTPQQFILHTGVMSNKDYASPEYVVLLHKGWISANTIPCPKDIVPAPCWDVLLTASGVDTVHAVAPALEDDKNTFTIPVAKRELISVTGISKQANSAVVEFTWKWAPVNEVGAALYSTDQRFRSDVGFRQYDDGWRIVPGVPRPIQPMDDALKNAEPMS